MRLDKEQIRAALPPSVFFPSLGFALSQKPGLRHELVTTCPRHSDAVPSLRVNESKGTFFCDPCNWGGDIFDFYAAVKGLDPVRDFSVIVAALADCAGISDSGNGNGRAETCKIAAVYSYQGVDRSHVFDVVRTEPKGFRQRRPDGKGGYLWNLSGVRPLLYRLPEIQGHESVIVVEGEKCVHRLADALAAASIAVPVTTNPMGAGKWARSDYTAQLVSAGVKRVTVLPDNDPPGQRHAREIARSCMAAGLHVRIVELPGLTAAKADIVDWLDGGHDVRELIAIARETPMLTEPPIDEPAAVVPIAPHVAARERVESPSGDVVEDVTPEVEDLFPDPMRNEAHYGLAGEIVAALAPYTEGDPHAMLLQFLTRLSAAIGRGPYFIVSFSPNYLHLNLIVCGDSGSGKGQAENAVAAVFNACAFDWQASTCLDASSGEAIVYLTRDPVVDEKQETVDPGVTDKRKLFVFPEMSLLITKSNRDGNSTSATLRNAFDGKDLENNRAGRQCRATSPHIAISGHITPEDIALISEVELKNGWSNRMLWCSVKASRDLPDGGGSPRSLDVFRKPLTDVYEFARRVGEMRRDAAAAELWESVYPGLKRGAPGLVGSITARGRDYVMKLACLYALLDCSAIVRVVHLRAALAAWQYCADSARFIFGGRDDERSERILRTIRAAGSDGIARSKITKGVFNGHISKDDLSRLLQGLQSRRLVTKEIIQPASGPRMEVWRSITRGAVDALNEPPRLATVTAMAAVAGVDRPGDGDDDSGGWGGVAG